MPEDISKYLSKEKAILSNEKPMYNKVDGKTVVFTDWTTKRNNKIHRWNDCELEIITEILLGKENITVYATWGFDEDGNGTADALEDWGVTSYDLAGGISLDGIEKYDEEVVKIGKTHMVETAPMKDGYKFIGWKYKDKVYQSGDSIEVKVQTASMKPIAEWKDGSLTISKLIDGTRGDTKKDFHFRVHLQDTKINRLFGDISFKSGVSDELTLKHGECESIINPPLGTAYEVVEVESNRDGYIATSKGVKDKTTTNASTVEFLSTRGSTPTEPEVKTGSLMISNTVAGNEEEQKKDFTLTVTLSDKRITGVYGDTRFKQGVANIVLRHEESIAAKGFLPGICYAVEDTDDNKAYKVKKSGETGIIKEGEIASAKFLYYRKDSADIDKGVKDNVTNPSWCNEKENELESSANVNTPGTKEVPEIEDESNKSLWMLLLVAPDIVISILTASKIRKETHCK